jgi:hypothetical protein
VFAWIRQQVEIEFTNFTGLHVYLCAHGYIQHRRAPADIQRQRKAYVWAMFSILLLSTTTFGLEVAFLYASLGQAQGRLSPENLLRLTNALQTFLGLTHAAAAGLLVSFRWILVPPAESIDTACASRHGVVTSYGQAGNGSD